MAYDFIRIHRYNLGGDCRGQSLIYGAREVSGEGGNTAQAWGKGGDVDDSCFRPFRFGHNKSIRMVILQLGHPREESMMAWHKRSVYLWSRSGSM